MIDRTRELEYALGTCIKKIEDNELETSVLQRRCLRATRDLNKNDVITSDMFEPLRPAPKGTVLPFEKDNILGKKLCNDIKLGNSVNWSDIIL